MPARIHVFGASGSGTTTLAAALSAKDGRRPLGTAEQLTRVERFAGVGR